MREQRRIKRKRQRIIFALVMIFLITVITCYIIRPVMTEALDKPLQVVNVVVIKGDSLWKIADRYDNNKIDLRQYIYLIEKYNGLDSAVLQPGQRLYIPIY